MHSGAQGIDQRRPGPGNPRRRFVGNPRSERRARYEAQVQAWSSQPWATAKQSSFTCFVDVVVL